MPFHTDLRRLFEALNGRQREFDWLLTDLELNVYPPGISYQSTQEGAVWLDGTALSAIVEENDVQFIWGVLSGFPRGVRPDLSHLEPHPFACGNVELWAPDVQLQQPLAAVEIVCWDSSATILLSRDDDLSQRFREHFTDAVDLDEHNRQLAGRN